MKWTNHECMAFAIPLAVTGNVWVAMGSILFAVIPDSMEGSPDSRVMSHRGKSHNPIFWAVVLGAALVAAGIFHCSTNGISLEWFGLEGPLTYNLWMMALWGIGCHLFCDSLTIGGIPIGKSRFAFKVFKTGDAFEYLLTYTCLALAILLRVEDIKFLFDH